MKIQELAIILIIIILPISIVLSVYTQFQINTIGTQTVYDSKLTSATLDALKAFQLNTENSTMSDLSNSKIRDIEASIQTFRSSMMSTFGLNGYTEEELNQYIPALVYTMYDGFYIYSPYENQNNLGINNDGKTQYGLKPYITYSCRYKKGTTDVVITYSLDNYIVIQGTINGKYVSDEGYLIDGITNPKYDVNGNITEITYNGIKITTETNLTEYVDGNMYPYIKVNGTKYYYNSSNNIVFYISNGTIVTQYKGQQAMDYYNNVIKNNIMALKYYESALKFKQRLQGYSGITELKYSDASEVTIDKNGRYVEEKIWPTNDEKIFEFNTTVENPTAKQLEKNIECETSNFNQHRLAVIRNKIETNLSIAIANYNKYSAAGVEFQMPELKEEEWAHVMNNISLISFVQGLNIGGKIYNGYTIVNNSKSKEVVREENIYMIGKDGYYHKINEKNLDIITDAPAGRLNLDFDKKTVTTSTVTRYYYPLRQLASYESIVTQNNVEVYEDIYIYVSNLNTEIRKAYYTALGRERAGTYKATTNTI